MLTKIDSIPSDLRNLKQFVCATGTDKLPKNPYTGGNAQTNNPSTWGTYNDAIDGCRKYGFDYIGFVFTSNTPYFGVDLDHCLDKVDFCDEFVETLQSYSEISRSGKGLHIICKGSLPDGARRKGGVEMYSSGRYFICTGNIYNEKYTSIRDCTEEIKILHAKYFPSSIQNVMTQQTSNLNLTDEEILTKARNSKTGSAFNLLYSGQWQGMYYSQSEADLAFCNYLAFWTGRNEEQMDRIFRNSGLYREKWDQRRGSDTYGRTTIGKACAMCKDVYDPSNNAGGDDTSLAMALFRPTDTSTEVSVPMGSKYAMTDTGNAQRLYDRFGKVIRYSYNRKKWYFWTGKRWEIDDNGEIKKLADMICKDIKREAFNCRDDETRDQLLKYANKIEQSRNKEAMIKECQHIENIPVSPEDFDSNPGYLNCQNGIVNLRNGELMPHDSLHMMTKICNCDYDVSHGTPKRWMQFLDEVTNGDKELQNYIQKCIGYSLSGSTQEQCAYFLYGLGNNGKSTFLDTIAEMLGTYAANTQPDTIMLQSKIGSTGGGANSDIARLKSARFVTCEEPTEGIRLNEGLLKQLTGGSKVTCRFLYGEEFEYTPEFKIWVATNHKPVIRGTDLGIWRRVRLIPFEVNIPSDKIDKHLKFKLRNEFPQILAWAVDGCIKWINEGMTMPQAVYKATKDYQSEMDLIASFMEECILVDYNNNDIVMASDMFALYTKWANMNNEYGGMTSKKFLAELSKKVPEKGRNSKGTYFNHVSLTEYADSIKNTNYRAKDFN